MGRTRWQWGGGIKDVCGWVGEREGVGDEKREEQGTCELGRDGKPTNTVPNLEAWTLFRFGHYTITLSQSWTRKLQKNKMIVSRCTVRIISCGNKIKKRKS